MNYNMWIRISGTALFDGYHCLFAGIFMFDMTLI